MYGTQRHSKTQVSFVERYAATWGNKPCTLIMLLWDFTKDGVALTTWTIFSIEALLRLVTLESLVFVGGENIFVLLIANHFAGIDESVFFSSPSPDHTTGRWIIEHLCPAHSLLVFLSCLPFQFCFRHFSTFSLLLYYRGAHKPRWPGRLRERKFGLAGQPRSFFPSSSVINVDSEKRNMFATLLELVH